MATDLNLSGSVRRTEQGNELYWYGGGGVAWANLAAAYAGIPSAVRYGKIFGVATAGVVSEYIWNDASALANGDEIPYAQGGTTLTPDQVDAIDNANAPNAGNPFATMADIVSGVVYQGTWNASTNTPTLTSSVGTQGYYYVVNVAGTTNLDGITDWEVGDWAIFNGTVWQKADNTEAALSINTTPADLRDNLIANSLIQIGVRYRVVSGGSVFWVFGIAANKVSTQAQLEGTDDGTTWTQGAFGSYDVATGFFIPAIRIDKNGSVFTGGLNTTNTLTLSGNNEFFVGSNNNNLSSASARNKFETGASSNILINSGYNYFGGASLSNSLTDSGFNKFGLNTSGNTLVGGSQNTFGDIASTNNLLNSSFNTFGNSASNNTIGDTGEYNTFGDKSTNNTLGTGCSYNTFKKNAIYNTIGDGSTNNVFEDYANQFNFGNGLTYCIVATGLNGGVVDFSSATQLYGRTEYWSINKILGTDLIEVTFDTGLTTAKTGIYDTQSDTFTPYDGNYTPTLTPDGVIITAATLNRAKTQSNGESFVSISLYIEATVNFATPNGTIDYTMPYGTLDSSIGSLSFNLSAAAPILPISGYERNGTIYIDCADTTFSGSIGIFVTVTAEITVP